MLTAIALNVTAWYAGDKNTLARIGLTHYLQDSMATDHGVIAKECTNEGRALFLI